MMPPAIAPITKVGLENVLLLLRPVLFISNNFTVIGLGSGYTNYNIQMSTNGDQGTNPTGARNSKFHKVKKCPIVFPAPSFSKASTLISDQL